MKVIALQHFPTHFSEQDVAVVAQSLLEEPTLPRKFMQFLITASTHSFNTSMTSNAWRPTYIPLPLSFV